MKDDGEDTQSDGDTTSQPERKRRTGRGDEDQTDDTPKPQDKHAIILGSSDTNFASDLFFDVK